MGIGVSYTGYDGKTRHSVAQNATDLPRIMEETRRQIERGEAGAPRVGERLALPRKQEAPDPVDGPLVGIEGNESPQPDGQFRMVGAKGGWRIPVTRTEMKVEPSMEMGCNQVTLTKLQYDLIISEKGLVRGRTEEREVWHKSFFVLAEAGEGTGNGKYGVRAFVEPSHDDKERPHLKFLAFGTEADLDTWDGNVFASNYKDGMLVDNPPVKIVDTAGCAYNPYSEEEG